MGNLASIQNMLKHIGVRATISGDAVDLESADKLILPGVGSFDNGTKNLNELGLVPVLNRRVREDLVPVLGICLGMQLFTRRSEEGTSAGLGWIAADTRRFALGGESARLKVPHMGWNAVAVNKESVLFREIHEEPRFYFVHSYHLVCDDEEDVLCRTHHGYDFASAVERGNVYGVQFHPEKSHKFGMKLLENFARRA